MAHTSITASDNDRYYAGDAIDLPFTFLDETGSEIDLTGMQVEFRIKDSLTDNDADALLEKTGHQGTDEIDISFVNPELGECDVHINTGDTESFITTDGTREESRTLNWHIRVIDGSGNRVTSETGKWEMWAS